MIELITSQNARQNSDLLEQMFRLRYRIFKEQLGWDVGGDNGLEQDEFDRRDTAYLLVTDEAGSVTGAWRLLPTVRPYMASTVFRPLFGDMEPPRSPHVWECSRFVVNPSQRCQSASGIDADTAALLVGVTEFAVTCNVREIISVETPAVARLHQRARDRAALWRGRAQRLGQTKALVARYDIDGALLDHLRQKFEAPSPIIKQLAVWDQDIAA